MEKQKELSNELCACGCGQYISVRAARAKKKGYTLGYVKGHIWKGKILPKSITQHMTKKYKHENPKEKKKEKNCIICGKPLFANRTKYCSSECYSVGATGKTRPKLWTWEIRTCSVCGKEFQSGGKGGKKRDQLTCSNDCSGILRRKSIDHFWDEKNGIGGITNWNEFRRKIFKKYDNKCFMCENTPNKLQLHHIIPRKFGGTHDEENLMPVCSVCHGHLDGIINLIIKNNPFDDPIILIKEFYKLLGFHL